MEFGPGMPLSLAIFVDRICWYTVLVLCRHNVMGHGKGMNGMFLFCNLDHYLLIVSIYSKRDLIFH